MLKHKNGQRELFTPFKDMLVRNSKGIIPNPKIFFDWPCFKCLEVSGMLKNLFAKLGRTQCLFFNDSMTICMCLQIFDGILMFTDFYSGLSRLNMLAQGGVREHTCSVSECIMFVYALSSQGWCILCIQ